MNNGLVIKCYVEGIPSKGITLWLDCTRSECVIKDEKDRIIQWLSVDKKTKLTPTTYLHRLKSNVSPQIPYVVPPQQQQSFFLSKFAGIQVDYLHTFNISPQLTRVQTICSYHSFNQLLVHEDVFRTTQDRGTWCNFYLFGSTNWNHYPFHTRGNVNNQHRINIMDKKHEIGTLYCNDSQTFGKGKISLDGDKFMDIKHASHWTHSRIAIYESRQLMKGLKINLIGAERQCHHFSGILHEVIVYDRLLNEQEKKMILLYFFKKYHKDIVDVLIHSLHNNWRLNNGLIYLFLSFVLPNGLVQLINSK